jgi:hypothetical protein
MQSKLYPLLVDTVKKPRTITYTEIAENLDLGDVSEPQVSDQISEMLRVIALQEHEAGRPTLTTCVVVRSWNGTRPGSGFYRQMRELGRFDSPSDNDKLWFHLRELWTCYIYWNCVEVEPTFTTEMARKVMTENILSKFKQNQP